MSVAKQHFFPTAAAAARAALNDGWMGRGEGGGEGGRAKTKVLNDLIKG